MEKSDSKTSQKHGSGDEREEQRDEEQPTTSRANNSSPVQISHNMNDLKSLDFNSADEVRQAMKAILTCKIPPQSFSEEPMHLEPLSQSKNPEPISIPEIVQNPKLRQDVHKIQNPVSHTVQNQVQENLIEEIKNTTQSWTCKPNSVSSKRKKRGRPPKAGPSKRIKKPKISSMYLGKLSNVVPFRRRWESDSESDVESVVIYY